MSASDGSEARAVGATVHTSDTDMQVSDDVDDVTD